MQGVDDSNGDLNAEARRAVLHLVEFGPDAIVIVDRAGQIVLVNATTENMFGYRRSELIGQRVEILVPAGFEKRHSRARHEYLANPHTRPMGVGLDLWGQRSDGTTFPIDIGLTALDTERGGFVAAVVRDLVSAVVLISRLTNLLNEVGPELGAFLGRHRSRVRESPLTPRELEILQLAAQGLSGPAIAARLSVSPSTVKTHFANIYGKLSVSDRASAVAHAMRGGFLR